MYHLLGRNKIPSALGRKETSYEVLCLNLPYKGPWYYVEKIVDLVFREQEAKMADAKEVVHWL